MPADVSERGQATVHLVTGEFPPQFGGVSDYTSAVAGALAARGIQVHVWCPAAEGTSPAVPGVTVHRTAGQWNVDDLARLDCDLDQIAGPRRTIVQWVPHAFGRRSLNVAFCAWIRRRARKGDVVDLMVHEACFAFGEGGWKQDVAALVHRFMLALLLSRATHVWMSTPAWAGRLRPWRLGRRLPLEWLPVPSNVPIVDDAGGVRDVRRSVATEGDVIVGHFGTYEHQVCRSLTALVPPLLSRAPRAKALFTGRHSDVFKAALVESHPAVADRVHATGQLESRQLSTVLQACDLVVQPYPDGASSRRTSLMAALAHGIPVVTTEGRLSEPLWRESGAVEIVPAGDAQSLLNATLDLCHDESKRRRLATLGLALYSQRFALAHTIEAILACQPQPIDSAA